MFTLLPVILLLICVPLLIKYPITRESHASLMEQLQKKRLEREKDK